MPNAQGQLPMQETVRIATEVAGALDHAQRLDIVHRDIKPEHIMLQDGGASTSSRGLAA